jgi:hypothetical protein
MSGNGNGNGKLVQGLDIPIVKLVPRSERKVSAKDRKRIEASLRAVGLLEPLVVYPLDDDYEILDGVLRYQILLEMGVEIVPCLLWNQRDGFTSNRMVNQLSPAQEMRMLRKSLEDPRLPLGRATGSSRPSYHQRSLRHARSRPGLSSGVAPCAVPRSPLGGGPRTSRR